MSMINQKEYLKKYLSLGDEKEKSKKRKKKSKIMKDRLKIIDDDVDVPRNMNENEFDAFLTAEDAPQVVGIVDERPLSMRLDDYRKSDKWKLVGSDDEEKQPENNSSQAVNNKKNSNLKKSDKNRTDSDRSPSRNKQSDSDASPPRKSKSSSKVKEYVKRKSRFTDASPPRNPRRCSDSDPSPPRKSRRNSDSDASPPRKSRKYKKQADSDESPPRKHHKNASNSDDESPPRKHIKKQRNLSESPPRKLEKSTNYSKYDSDSSPARKNSKSKYYDRKDKSLRHDKASPPQRNSHKESLSKNDSKHPKKMSKTLDGKVAGLQSGKDLKQETAALRKREDELFKNMSAEVSGKNAAPILRDRKTGKKRDLEKEAQEELEKQQIENAKKEKYDKWGKGLKQVEDRKEKIQDELHEMAKPLARYADDEDLEKYLKDQEREGDPMLQYIRKKRREHAVATGKPINSKPIYEGEFMPNRFGIPPGHRWDGVDRSNGFEKQWFEVQNSKKAIEEEIYKWNTEDM